MAYDLSPQESLYIHLAKQEDGWKVIKQKNEDGDIVPAISVHERVFPILHPYQIYLRLYRDEVDSFHKFNFMKRINDLLWPQYIPTWNKWTERRFRAHCEQLSYITLAGGASAGKSLDVAKIALIFWLSNPKKNACIIASTTLESLESRIWGYVVKLAMSADLEIPIKILRSKPPKIMFPGQVDKIHGMFAIAVKQGEDDQALSTVIGRHPDHGMMVVLDEATDINPVVIKAFPNLEQGVEFFQLWAIGNSNSKTDLHGSMATPRAGWDSVNPMKDYSWPTTHDRGVCLYFNPYDSPAITEEDPIKKGLLSKFLITLEGIKEKEDLYGKHSAAFARFVLGYWAADSFGETGFTTQFLNEHLVGKLAEWSGLHPYSIVAGLDPEFQIGGTGCVLRLAILGQTTSGSMVLDFRKEELLFKLQIQLGNTSSERQIAEQVIAILRRYSCPVANLALDATGVGRALGELILLISGEQAPPYRVVSVRPSTKKGDTDPHIVVIDPGDMWLAYRNLVQYSQIRGVDEMTLQQLINRRIEFKNKKMILESKKVYRDRMSAINPRLAHSPDESDAMMLATQAAIRRFGLHPGMKKELANAGVDGFWQQKAYVLERERKAEETAAQIADLRPSRPPLLPNFAGTLEDTVKPKRFLS